jgi:F-type H+-transporting ATPase subunit b
VLTAVVTANASGAVEVSFAEDAFVAAEEGEKEVPDNDLNPIAFEWKEGVWGFGAFLVLLIALRLWLFPIVRNGMQSRYDMVHDDLDSAEALTASARADVAEYEARLASVRAEAQQKIDAARATLETERSEKLAAANAAIAERRAAAAAGVDAARQEAMGDVESAVADVVSRATEIATGKPADPSSVTNAVRSAMGAEVSS